MYQKKKKKNYWETSQQENWALIFERGNEREEKKQQRPIQTWFTWRKEISFHRIIFSFQHECLQYVCTHIVSSRPSISLSLKKLLFFFCSLSEKFFCDIFTASASSHLWEKKIYFCEQKKIYRTLRRGRNTRGKKFVMWRIK